jgi:hypothetical protein
MIVIWLNHYEVRKPEQKMTVVLKVSSKANEGLSMSYPVADAMM